MVGEHLALLQDDPTTSIQALKCVRDLLSGARCVVWMAWAIVPETLCKPWISLWSYIIQCCQDMHIKGYEAPACHHDKDMALPMMNAGSQHVITQ